MNQRIGGTIEFKIDGEIYNAKGSWTYNLGRGKRETIVGADGVHGYKEMPQVPYIEGVITDRGDLSIDTLLKLVDATAMLQLANGKIIVLRDAIFAGDGNVTTEEGEIEARFEGVSAEEVR